MVSKKRMKMMEEIMKHEKKVEKRNETKKISEVTLKDIRSIIEKEKRDLGNYPFASKKVVTREVSLLGEMDKVFDVNRLYLTTRYEKKTMPMSGIFDDAFESCTTAKLLSEVIDVDIPLVYVGAYAGRFLNDYVTLYLNEDILLGFDHLFKTIREYFVETYNIYWEENVISYLPVKFGGDLECEDEYLSNINDIIYFALMQGVMIDNLYDVVKYINVTENELDK